MFRFDSSDPHFLIVYSGDEHATPDDFRNFGKHWIAMLERGDRFGVIFLDEPHEHTHDHDEQEHREHEAEITRLTNDFRRDYREFTAKLNVGYARVMPSAWMEQYFSEPGSWERALEQNDRFAQYNWGIPGGGFTDLASAKTWLLDQFNRIPTEEYSDSATQNAPNVPIHRVGLFYGSSTGMTEYVASKIQEAWQTAGMEPIEAVNIGKTKDAARLLDFDHLILGIPTWNIGQLQDDWDILFPQLDLLDFTGKKIALFGVGDQYGYPDNFLDAVGILGEKLLERGADLIGRWYDAQYEFAASRAFVDGKFMGLGIDEDHQANLTDARIKQWIAQIITEFAVQPTSVSKR